MPRLERWSVVSKASDGYYPVDVMRLSGHVYGHPLHADGTFVTTSRVAASEGRTVTTRSGTVYELGGVEPAYREWLRDTLGKEIDEAHPVKLLEG